MGGFTTIGHINTHICVLFESGRMHLEIAAKYRILVKFVANFCLLFLLQNTTASGLVFVSK